MLAALEDAMQPSQLLAEAVALDLETLGERMVGYMLAIWERPRDREVMVGMLRAATTNARGARFLRDFIAGEVLQLLESRLEPREARLRASLAGSQIVGLALYRYVLKVEPLASATPQELTRLVAPTLQRYLTGPLEGDRGQVPPAR